MNALVLLVTLFISCTENMNDKNMHFALQDAKVVESADEDEFEVASNLPPSTQPATLKMTDKKLIRNGSLDFETDQLKKTKSEIEKICKELNAYISLESENNYENRFQYTQTIRVPADQFDILITRLEVLAKKIESKNINTEDVTEQFIDVETRLKTKKELEERYREILKQAKTIEDIVSIESEIATVRSEIESMEGRLNYLKNQVSFSTLNITYYETIGTDFGFASKFIQSLKGGWDNLLAFIIFLINLWPFVIGTAVLAFWWWSKRKNRKATS